MASNKENLSDREKFIKERLSGITGRESLEEINRLLGNTDKAAEEEFISHRHLIGKSLVKRSTGETDIAVSLSTNGRGSYDIHTGVGFFDHMLCSFARHGFFDLTVLVSGDLEVDVHHTIEDTGIVLGQALGKALGDKAGIRRYGSSIIPMDDALVMCAVDLSGRPYLSFDLTFPTEKIGDMDTQMVKEFFYAVSYSAGINIHLKQLSGENSHHVCEAAFKAFAKALDQAVELEERAVGALSTKGSL